MKSAENQLTDQIAELIGSCTQSSHVPFRGSFASCPVIELPIGAPRFRADNGRLAVVKQAHLQKHGLPDAYFEETEGSPGTQSQLQSFLIELARDEKGPIFQELQRTAVQTEPLLVTADGLVINGNRRLAAMRVLFEEDEDRFSTFAMVTAAVLPGEATPEDLEMTEAALQMAPETKLAYGWIDRRLKLRRHRETKGLGDDAIQQSYRLASVDQIETELSELALAERYLDQFAQAPKDYVRVSEVEPYFVGMQSNLLALDEAARETWTLAAFSMISQLQEDAIDPERYFPFAEPNPVYAPQLCLLYLGNELELWPTRNRGEGVPDLSSADHSQLQQALRSPAAAARIAPLLVKLLDRILAEHREEQLVSARHLIQSAQHLNRQLAKVGPGNFTDDQRRQLGGLLVETQYHAKIIGGERRQSLAETVLSQIAGWVYFIRRKALLFSKRGKSQEH